jgi:hypothetical protein
MSEDNVERMLKGDELFVSQDEDPSNSGASTNGP